MEAMSELESPGHAIEDDQDDEGDEAIDASISINQATTFAVDVEQEEMSRSSLDKTEQAVLELARSGMSIEKLKSVIPEPADEVQTALEGLVELGVLLPR